MDPAERNQKFLLQGRCGAHTSLYGTLNKNHVSHLEYTNWLRRIGECEKAHAIFCDELATVKDIPVVLIERCELFFVQRRLREMYSFLEPVIDLLRSSHGEIFGREERQLLELYFAHASLYHKGNIEPALEAMRQTRIWLWDVSVNDYSDIMASCVRQYIILFYRAKDLTSRIEPEGPFIPCPSSDRVAWQGVSDLRRSMTGRGLVLESMRVFGCEILLTLPKKKLQVIRSFQAELVDIIPASHPELMYLKTELSYERVKCLQGSDTVDLVIEIDHGLDLIQQWAASVGVSTIEYLPRRLSFVIEKLTLEPENGSKLQHALELYDVVAPRRHVSATSYLSLASSLCRDLAQQEASEERRVQFHSIQEKLEAYYLDIEGNFIDMLSSHQATLSVSNSTVDARKALEWIDGVIAEHPELTSPGHLMSLYTSRFTLSTFLGDQIVNVQSLQSMKELMPLLPTGVEPAYIGLGNKFQILPEDNGLEALDKRYVYDFSYAMFAPELLKSRIMSLILDFAEEGLQESTLTPRELHKVLGCECDLREDDLLRHLTLIRERKTHDPVQYFDQLFIADICRGFVDMNPETQGRVEDRYQILLTWLSRPANVSKNRRWLLLLMAREARRMSLMEKYMEYSFNPAHTAVANKLVIEEHGYCLRLYAQMPSAIKELQPSYQANLDGQLVHAHQYEFQLTKDNEALTKSELYRATLEERYRRENCTISLASELRSLAEINLLKIWRLFHEAGDPSQNAIQAEELCAKSLEALREAFDLNIALILDSTFAEGLRLIAERSKVMVAWSIRYTAELAVRCHLIPLRNISLRQPHLSPGSDQVFDMYEWVQRSKANILAQAMGTHRVVPAPLLSQIRASPSSDVLYSRFLNIQEGIQSAKLQSRFYLRRELDQHINEMRKDHLLQRVLDLEEGTPLSLAEMREIAVNAGSSVVFADWFQVDESPGYLPELLLFTIRIDPHSQTSSHGADVHFDNVTHVPGAIESWIGQSLNSEHWCLNVSKLGSRLKFADKFSGLIEPLRTRSQPGDVLVLCPTQNLHRMPLHALDLEIEVDGAISKVPLIHRNPIIYNYSYPLLRICFSDSLSARESAVASQPVFLHGIHSANLVTQTANFSTGRQCIEKLSQKYKVTALTDECSRKENLVRLLPSATILHLHTHCGWDDKNPLNHFVNLPDGPTAESKLIAADIFDVNMQPGSHVNLIACGGGRTQFDRGDEVMGLTPALMYAGASSTLSTLWPISDRDGARFSTAFFGSLGACVNENGKKGAAKTFDLARTVQKAVMAIDPRFDNLSSAAYVLHGYWMLPWKD